MSLVNEKIEHVPNVLFFFDHWPEITHPMTVLCAHRNIRPNNIICLCTFDTIIH